MLLNHLGACCKADKPLGKVEITSGACEKGLKNHWVIVKEDHKAPNAFLVT